MRRPEPESVILAASAVLAVFASCVLLALIVGGLMRLVS